MTQQEIALITIKLKKVHPWEQDAAMMSMWHSFASCVQSSSTSMSNQLLVPLEMIYEKIRSNFVSDKRIVQTIQKTILKQK